MPRGSGRSGRRAKKKVPPLNRYVRAKLQSQSGGTTGSSSQQSTASTSSAPENEDIERPTSASRRKLSQQPAEVDGNRRDWSGFRVVDIDKFLGEVTALSACKKCHSAIRIAEKSHCGLSSVFEAVCDKCGVLREFSNSEVIETKGKVVAEVNRRFVYAIRAIGGGHKDLEKVSALMDFPPAVSRPTYDVAVSKIHSAVSTAANESMHRAIEEEVEESSSRDIDASGDGSWQRRGHTSKNGIVSLIGVITGKVIDIEVLSTACRGCSSYRGPRRGEAFDEWWEEHQMNCDVNHEGSAGSMEAAGMVTIFRRSEHRANIRYKRFIGDGDSSTFPSLVKDAPYGPDFIPEKIECTGHVQKRMGTRLRKLKKDSGNKKLRDGKSMGGRGRLTDKKIDQIASYYGNAIRGSKTLPEMKNSVWAIFYHYRSTDQQPQHHLCPQGPETWCKYWQAVQGGTEARFKHKSSIPVAIMDQIKKTFEDLTDESLLKRCLGGHTQNPNESLNALIWKHIPKTVFCSRKVVEIGAFEAILTFNDGQRGHMHTYNCMDIVSGKYLVKWINREDNLRISSAQKRCLAATKEARKAKRRLLLLEQEMLHAEEGPTYGAGEF